METGNNLLKKEYPKISRRIEDFISNYLETSKAKGLTLGLSGGLDSAVALELCSRAVGSQNVLGLILPSKVTPKDDIQDGIDHAKKLSVRTIMIDIHPVVESYVKTLPRSNDRIVGNLTARIRMSILYYYAALENYLVVGTGDKSELLIGYFTKWGDGGSDLMPLANLYKTQVRKLARYLDIPQAIIEKKSSPRLWHGQFAEDELGINYNTIDPILYYLIDKNMKPSQVAKKLNMQPSIIRKVVSMVDANAHKRNMPPIACP